MGVILSNGHLTKKIRTYNREIASKLNSKTIIIYFEVDDQILRQRVSVSKRSTDILIVSKSLEDMLERQIALFEIPHAMEADYFLKLVGKKAPEKIADEIVNHLKSLQLL